MTLHRLTTLVVALAFGSMMGCERRPGSGEQSTTGEIVVGMYGSLTGEGASFGQSSV